MVTEKPQGLRQELRLGVVMTGGVSLAVWMGGVARELNLLLGQGEPKTDLARQVRDQYEKLLDLLDVDVSVDVLSGTSAGGINAAILGLANVWDVDIGSLRELWMTEGSLASLLRDPKKLPISSLLKGDEQLLVGLRKGFRQIASGSDANELPAEEAPASRARPTELFITTTLLDGLPSRFVDDYGTVVADSDHHGLFHFTTENLRDTTSPDRLALAGRCTASFPGAFEAAKLPIGAADEMHPDMAGLVNTFSTSYVADGGLLANRPIASAVRAVFDRPAGDEVRRLLLYVVPTAANPAGDSADEVAAPLLGRTLLRDLQAVMSQAISGDLAGIREHNERVRVRRDTRGLLAGMAASGILVTPTMWDEFRLRTADRAARRLVGALLERVEPARIPLGGDAPADGAPPLESRVNGLTDRIRGTILDGLPDWAPGQPLPLQELGFDAVTAAMTTALQLVNSIYGARPDLAARQQLATTRRAIHDALPPTPASVHAVVDTLLSEPQGDDITSLDLDALARRLHGAWVGAQPQPDLLGAAWNGISGALAQQLPTLRELVGPSDLLTFVEQGLSGDDAADVGQRLAQLYVAETTLLPDEPTVEQQLALVQVSADTTTALDPGRSTAESKLTGLQLHHFGAFYKSSWRANDWMWGRLDGAGWLVHVLLDPERILARRDLDSDPAAFTARFWETLEAVAGSAPPADVLAELRFLDAPGSVPTSLPRTAIWVAAGLQRSIVAEELPCIAEQIQNDKRAGAYVSDAAKQFVQTTPNGDAGAWLRSCPVSTETFRDEIKARLLRSTVAQAAAVTAAAVADSGALPTHLKGPMRRVARTLRWNLWLARHGVNAPEGWVLSRAFRRDKESAATGPDGNGSEAPT